MKKAWLSLLIVPHLRTCLLPASLSSALKWVQTRCHVSVLKFINTINNNIAYHESFVVTVTNICKIAMLDIHNTNTVEPTVLMQECFAVK